MLLCRSWLSPPARKRRGEEVDPDTPCCWVLLVAAREPTRRQWRWRVGRRATTVPAPRNPAEHCSGLQNCSLKIPDLFWCCYCNFNVYFCLFVLNFYFVLWM
ncbi:hypothetical protein BDE02_19G057100 [Populus trichocarpa]|nr:hypothetical protein BDE02_19G057000 [Populus trichocarpa]KAI5555079.1 hypothetical protein BDE02_19G057100 [Populus trichocarpa]